MKDGIVFDDGKWFGMRVNGVEVRFAAFPQQSGDWWIAEEVEWHPDGSFLHHRDDDLYESADAAILALATKVIEGQLRVPWR